MLEKRRSSKVVAVQEKLRSVQLLARQRGKCRTCLFLKANCICSRLWGLCISGNACDASILAVHNVTRQREAIRCQQAQMIVAEGLLNSRFTQETCVNALNSKCNSGDQSTRPVNYSIRVSVPGQKSEESVEEAAEESVQEVEQTPKQRPEEDELQSKENLPNVQKAMQIIRSGLELSILIYMHWRERIKASNTGKLVLPTADEVLWDPDESYDSRHHNLERKRRWGHPGLLAIKSSIYICGIPEDENALHKVLNVGRKDSATLQAVLFPSKNALSLNEILRNIPGPRESVHDAPIDTLGPPLVKRLQLVLVDGTWHEARRMVQRLPCFLPRIKLDSAAVSAFAIRNQSTFGRICTAEAAALLARDLANVIPDEDGSPAHSAIALREWSDILLRGLELLIDTQIHQAHKTFLLPELMQRNLGRVLAG